MTTVRRAPLSACLGTALLLATLSCAGPAGAAGQRSFVSTSGADNPACSLPAPCRTFGAAITVTSPGGEVIVLDSGGYGAVTITKSISIVAPPGVYAGISVFSGNGVTISTAASDVVRLSGLTINNLGGCCSFMGIYHASAGNLVVSDVVVSGFEYGIQFTPTASSDLVVERTTVTGSTNAGIYIVGGASVVARAILEDIFIGHGAAGLFIFDNARAVVRRASIVANGDIGIAVQPALASSSTELLLESSTVSHNAWYGVSVGHQNGSSTVTIVGSTLANNLTGVTTTNAANVRLVGTTITRNTTGIHYGGGSAQSQGNNFIYGNTADGTAPTVVGPK